MLLICLVALVAGFVFTTFFPAAPYGVLAPSIVAIAGTYFTKRLLQKQEKYNGIQPDGQLKYKDIPKSE
jgi:uncharacterized membrane protein YeaQ/YmgE (transglycosylase-associated protein family)